MGNVGDRVFQKFLFSQFVVRMRVQNRRQRIDGMKQAVELSLAVAFDARAAVAVQIRIDLRNCLLHEPFLPLEIPQTDCPHSTAGEQKKQQQTQRKPMAGQPEESLCQNKSDAQN